MILRRIHISRSSFPDDLGGYPLAGGKEVMKQEKVIILSNSIIYMLINMLKL